MVQWRCYAKTGVTSNKKSFVSKYSTSISTYVKELERIFMVVVSNRNTVF